MIKERPILFSAPMVRAILDERKTQTRRIVKNVDPEIFPYCGTFDEKNGMPAITFADDVGDCVTSRILATCRQGKPGDRIWVRETFCVVDDTQLEGDKWIDYRATPRYSEYHPAGWDNDPENPEALKWKPSIHMPRWASRILLEITDVRVERLQDMSEEDAMDEGTGIQCPGPMAIMEFSMIWESINGQGSWDLNPWVWVVEFKRIG